MANDENAAELTVGELQDVVGTAQPGALVALRLTLDERKSLAETVDFPGVTIHRLRLRSGPQTGPVFMFELADDEGFATS